LLAADHTASADRPKPRIATRAAGRLALIRAGLFGRRQSTNEHAPT
jgi:hypothetical protein